MTALVRDLTDAEARVALPCKWGEVEPDVLPAWVAEMDYGLAEPITEALQRAVAAGMTGYPASGAGGPLGAAYAGFAARQFGHEVDPDRVVPTVDVTAGVRLALEVLAPAGGLVFPVPGYAPQLAMAAITGRQRHDLTLDPDAERAELDLDHLDRLFADGARVLLLTQPHNPWGRAFSRAELEGVRDVVLRHGGFVVSDEIHAPLVLDGRPHVSYLDVEGTAEHAVAVVSAPSARNESWSILAVEASVAAYTHGDAWLDALRQRLSAQRDLLERLLAAQLPLARVRPVEATYLAWVDLRGYGHDDPAAVALDRGRVRVAPGHDYQPGLPGHARLNFATSADRLTEVVRRLSVAL